MRTKKPKQQIIPVEHGTTLPSNNLTPISGSLTFEEQQFCRAVVLSSGDVLKSYLTAFKNTNEIEAPFSAQALLGRKDVMSEIERLTDGVTYLRLLEILSLPLAHKKVSVSERLDAIKHWDEIRGRTSQKQPTINVGVGFLKG